MASLALAGIQGGLIDQDVLHLGVEVGQLAIVLVVSLLLAWVARRSPLVSRRLAIAGSVIVIWAGAFWFVERAFFA